MSSDAEVAGRLRAMLPELKHSRETHRQWRDHIRSNPFALHRNPDIGDAEFHERMLVVYDERIAAITEAAERLSEKTHASDQR